MAVSSSSLQALLDDLKQCCRQLSPEVRPSQLRSCSLQTLAEAEGLDVSEAMRARLQAAAAAADSCCACGAACSMPDQQQPLLLTSLSFEKKQCTLLKAGFACEDCRQLLHPEEVVCTASSMAASSSGGRQKFLQLCMHLASINGAPEHILANPDAAVAWGQEVFCRAYSLHVLASGIGGWKLATADGAEVQAGEQGTAMRVLEACLVRPQPAAKARKKKSRSSGPNSAADTPQPTSTKAARRRAAGLASPSTTAPHTILKQHSKPSAKRSAAAAVAAAAAAAVPVAPNTAGVGISQGNDSGVHEKKQKRKLKV